MQQQLAPITLLSIQRPVRAGLDRSIEELGRIVKEGFPLIEEVNQHLLRIRGKMFRPTLLLLSAQATGGIGEKEIALAAIVELIHLATLVHDDSIDHSVLRRGQPTVNSLFTHEVAVIVGDFLYSRAITTLVDLGDMEALRVVSRFTNELTVGQLREVEANDDLDYSEEAYDRLIHAKTASLMAGACESGALGGPPEFREALRSYGTNLGMAFQITDDCLDYTGSEEVTGKPSGLDLKEHKITLPLIAALPHMSAEERRVAERLMSDPEPPDELVDELVTIVTAKGGIDRARERAMEFAQRAERDLEVLDQSEARDALRDCLAYVMERRR